MLSFNEDQQQRSDAYDSAVANDDGLAQSVRELSLLVASGRANLADVGGFGETELAGGYAAAAAQIEAGQPAKALKVLGSLLVLNPRIAKFYRLAGIALHHLKEYTLADGYYDIALTFDPYDALAKLYRGEVHLLTERRASGRELINRGLAEADDDPSLHAIAQRARAIAKTCGVVL